MSNLKTKKGISLPIKMLIGLVLGASAGLIIGQPMTKIYFLSE